MSDALRTIIKTALLGLPFIVVIISGTLVYQAQGGFWGSAREGSITVAGIYLGTTLLMVFSSLFHRIVYRRWHWISALVLALVYSYVMTRSQPGLKIHQALIPLVFYCLLVNLITIKVFYNRAMIKFRTLLTALAGALIFTLAMLLIYRMSALPVEEGFFINKYVNGLYLFIFLGVGLSLSDMVIYKMEIRELRDQEPADDQDDELEG